MPPCPATRRDIIDTRASRSYAAIASTPRAVGSALTRGLTPVFDAGLTPLFDAAAAAGCVVGRPVKGEGDYNAGRRRRSIDHRRGDSH